MTVEDLAMVNYILRWIGRIGFVILIFTIYRVYALFASPQTKLQHQWFIRGFGASIVVSFIILFLDYFIPSQILSSISVGFNVLTMLILAVYIHLQGNVLDKFKSSDEYKEAQRTMDALILKMKHR